MRNSAATLVVGCALLLAIAPGIAFASGHVSLSASDKTVAPGSTVTLSYTLKNTGSESLNGPAINVTNIPDGWTVQSHADAGGSYKDSQHQWLWLSVSPSNTKTVSLTLTVPSEASGSYEIPATVLLNGEVAASATATVTISDSSADHSTDTSTETPSSTEATETSSKLGTLNLTVSNTVVRSNGSISFDIVVRNPTDTVVTGPAVDLSVPDGWTVTSHADAGGTYRASKHQWVWLSIDRSATKTVSVTIAPANDVAPASDISVSAEAILQGNVVAQTTLRPSLATATATNVATATATNVATATATGNTGASGPGFGIVPFGIALCLFVLGRLYTRG